MRQDRRDISGRSSDGIISDGRSSDGQPDGQLEEMQRAHLYRLLATFLGNPPDKELLAVASGLHADASPLGKAIATFAHLSGRTPAESAAAEFDSIFIGLARGELLPFGSYYQTGFLHEKPLAVLRADMARLGIERDPSIKDPEDHIASVLEIMAGLIDGTLYEGQKSQIGQAGGADLATQRAFFDRHLNSWAPHFFADLEQAQSSVLYATLGTIGRLFLEIEARSFEMAGKAGDRPGA